MSLLVRLIHDRTDLEAMGQVWTSTLLRSGAASVFSSHEWITSWWQHFGAERMLYVMAVYTEANRLVGIAPLMMHVRGPFRKLEFIGTGLSDTADFVLDLEYASESVQAILHDLHANQDQWDLADLKDVPSYSMLSSYLRSVESRQMLVTQFEGEGRSVVTLPDSWPEYAEMIDPKLSHRVGSVPDRFEHKSRLYVHTVTAPTEVGEAVEGFRRLHAAMVAARASLASPIQAHPNFYPFIEQACSRLADQGWLRIVDLRLAERTVCSSVNFVFGTRWLSFLRAYEPASLRSRMETLFDAAMIKQAISEGGTRFQFCRGQDADKSELGTTRAKTTRILLATTSPRALMTYMLTVNLIGGQSNAGRSK